MAFGVDNTRMDSLYNAWDQAPRDTQLLHDIIHHTRFPGREVNQKKIDYYNWAIRIADSLDHRTSMYELRKIRGMSLLAMGKANTALEWYFEDLKLAKRQHEADWITYFQYMIGDMSQRLGEYDTALEYFHLAERSLDVEIMANLEFRIYLQLGWLYKKLDQIGKANAYMEKSWLSLKDLDSRFHKGWGLYHITKHFLTIDEPERFGFFLKEWRDFQAQRPDFHENPDVYHYSIAALIEEDRPKAIENVRNAIHYFKGKEGHVYRLHLAYTLLGDLLRMEGRDAEAKTAYLEALDFHRRTDTKEYLIPTYQKIYLMAKATGEDSLAFHMLKNRFELRDSIQNIDLQLRIKELENSYALTTKENEYAAQQISLMNSKRQRNMVIFVCLFILTLMGLAWNHIRNRGRYDTQMANARKAINEQRIQSLQKEKELLSISAMISGQEQERMRIARDLHDSLGGLLTAMKAHFDTYRRSVNGSGNDKIASRTLNLIDKACNDVRKLSHTMMPHTLTMSGLEGAVDDLAGWLEEKGITCQLEMFNVEESSFTDSQVISIYRIVQELCQTSYKKGNTDLVFLQLFQSSNELLITYEEDNPGGLTEQDNITYLDLQARMNYLKATHTIEHDPDQGTTHHINIPIHPEQVML